MPVVKFERDGSDLIIESVFDAAPAVVWRLFTDARLVEKWWGPPTWPASFSTFNAESGGRALYCLNGPDGEKSHGWWKFEQVEFPRLIFVDGLSESDGEPSDHLPTSRAVIDFFEHDGKTLVSHVNEYESAEALTQMLELGVEEGFQQTIHQISRVLRELTAKRLG